MRSIGSWKAKPIDIPPKLSASLPIERKKLLRLSTQRGMLENDLILGTFAIKYLSSMTDEEVSDFEFILQAPDPEVFKWITKKLDPPAQLKDSALLQRIQVHAQDNPLGYKKDHHD